MTSQLNQTCACGHSLDEHQRESMACQYRTCPCVHFIGEFPEFKSDRDEAKAQLILLDVVTALKMAHLSAFEARNEVERSRNIQNQPIEMDALVDIFPLATDSLTAAMQHLAIIIDGLTKKETS